MEIFFEQNRVPTNSCLLLATEAEARGCRKGDIRLGFCPRCGFVSNTAFDPRLTEYSDRYEETQGFSPTFRSFHETLARELIARHNLRDKRVLEIGCGKGEFLELLWRLGGNRCVGFDPSYLDDRLDATSAKNIDVIVDFYSEKYADYGADFVCCKMTLEHIAAPAALLSPLPNAVKGNPDAIVFFQVPESMRIFQTCAFEDIYYEHCSYFTAGSLRRLFQRYGFAPLRMTTEYAGQYLTIEATAAAGPLNRDDTDDLRELSRCTETFRERYQGKVSRWRSRIQESAEKGEGVVLWGSGSKAVSFLAGLNGDREIRFVVDINPHKHGHFMPGTGQEIVPPAALREIRPGLVIVMNSVYVPEIQESVHNLGLSPTVVSL
jgi:SAM-dependent methyltransferase